MFVFFSLLIEKKIKEILFRVFYYYEKKRKDFLLLCSPRHLYLVPTYSLVQWESQSNRSLGLRNYIFYLICSPRHLSLVPTYLQWKNQSECSSKELRICW